MPSLHLHRSYFVAEPLTFWLLACVSAEPVEHSLDDGDGPHYPQVKLCTPEFYHEHEHMVSIQKGGS